MSLSRIFFLILFFLRNFVPYIIYIPSHSIHQESIIKNVIHTVLKGNGKIPNLKMLDQYANYMFVKSGSNFM